MIDYTEIAVGGDVVRGSSGARIIVGKDTTWKYDTARTNGRVREQGIWLRNVDLDPKQQEIWCLPAVLTIAADGYEMETLRAVNLADANLNDILPQIYAALRDDLWLSDYVLSTVFEDGSVSDFNPRQHTRYVRKLARTVGCGALLPSLVRSVRRINWRNLRRVVTHGDPIVDNVLWRSHGHFTTDADIVLIDPIPSTQILPSVMALDVGRLIQSAVGYEQIRYRVDLGGSDLAAQVSLVLNMVFSEKFDINEARAALYWSVIHMMRGIRTAPSNVADELRRLTFVLCESVVEPWMR